MCLLQTWFQVWQTQQFFFTVFIAFASVRCFNGRNIRNYKIQKSMITIEMKQNVFVCCTFVQISACFEQYVCLFWIKTYLTLAY